MAGEKGEDTLFVWVVIAHLLHASLCGLHLCNVGDCGEGLLDQVTLFSNVREEGWNPAMEN